MASDPGSHNLYAQLADRIADLSLRGAMRVPVPAHFSLDGGHSRALPSIPRMDARRPSHETAVEAGRAIPCLLCPMCSASSVPRPLGLLEKIEKPHMVVILDHPYSPTEKWTEIIDESNPNHLVVRLLKKAHIERTCHVTYAMRAPSVLMPESQFIDACTRAWLVRELESLHPERVACFGAYARLAYNAALDILGPRLSAEVMHFPSTLELAHHPAWRKGVWEKFRALTLSGS